MVTIQWVVLGFSGAFLLLLLTLLVVFARYFLINRKKKSDPVYQFVQEREFDIFTDELFQALEFFQKHKVGVLILLKGKKPLNRLLLREGIPFDAHCSLELLKNIFRCRSSSIHDGATIIDRRYRITHASVLIKLLEKDIPQKFGTRHHAAYSVTKQSDTLAILVSESDGEIKFFNSQGIKKIEITNLSKLKKLIGEWKSCV